MDGSDGVIENNKTQLDMTFVNYTMHRTTAKSSASNLTFGKIIIDNTPFPTGEIQSK